MRRLLWLLLAAAGGVLAAGLVTAQPGYLLLAWGDWRVEIRSLLLALMLVLVLFLLLHWLLGSAARARQMLWRRRLARQLERRERSEMDLAAGLLALLDGHHAQAQKLLQRSRRTAAAPAIQALALAHLAKLRGDTATREREFAAASAAAPQAQAAIARLQAQAQLDAGDSLAAAATLKAVAEHDSPRLLELQARLCRARRDWAALHELLPRLRRAGIIDGTELARQEVDVACARLADSEVPDLLWPQLSRRLRRDGAVQLAYAEALRRAGRHDAAQERLAELLRDTWPAAAIELFGHYAGDDPQRWLTQAEQWLADHADDPTLLLAAGRLARRAGQWAKARAYLDSSLLLAPTAQAHLELAQLLEQMGLAADAAEHYRAGLRVAVSASTQAPAALTGRAAAADDRTHLLPHEA
ncbi:heme biosynthesis HemY N-terminal domain-containing protein [Immundisolibacter sp.]|uniref:heme biosynthesis protein HemY n=1 Tax=Immundisolibacter sp. TaxID=1934948 RepID=UPI0026248409|nr:heme biosynthesis HemY N-terminal domain-containing protein [Immundisolibacter sp.]MDD3649922.1 heme biosynthesis HemY N-terminal domain-containing protein [Immundisolibacter sp.]